MVIIGGDPVNDLQPPLPARPRLQQHAFREMVDLVLWIGLLFTLVNLATARYVVEGISMAPNFATGEYILVSRLHYLLADPQRGDIVVFHYPGNPTQDYIKRVIGVPGDAVEIRDRLVYVNGEALDEPYINELCEFSCPDNRWDVSDDQVFVMGDNRNHSSDSRAFGVVERRFIVGEALLRYLPLNKTGTVDSIAYPK
ncbi:MAG: signal peptidase I [Chloroflexota bacterium]|nr:signal peptidase I [Chloroflexota bacterium]